MKWLVLLALVVVGDGASVSVPTDLSPYKYHEREGIPRAAAARAAEEQVVSGRIFNGAPAALGQFPYYAALLIHLSTGGTSACGSALVSSTRLLTAAHCWDDGWFNADMFTVVLGSQFLFTGGTRIDTSDVEMHEGWRPGTNTFTDDLAVIRIPAVGFSNTIAPIVMAAGSADFAGQQATAKGVGITGQGHPISANQFLAFISVPVITNAQCALSYGSIVTDRIICTGAGAGNANICSSDSGGPVTVGNVLVGIVSFGNGGGQGCEQGLPAGHSRISAYTDWIQPRM